MSITANNKPSVLISDQVPDFVRDDHGRFVEFLESYYRFLEYPGNLQYITKNFTSYRDIDALRLDRVVGNSEYANNQINYFIPEIGSAWAADKGLIIKNFIPVAKTLGTEKSVRNLVRGAANTEIDFYYPKTDILRASDGKWFIEKSLNTKDFAVNNVANSSAYTLFRSKTIRGAISNSVCDVETAEQYYDNGALITELKISNNDNDFINGEELFTFFEEEGEVKRLSCNLFSGIIVSATVSIPGSGYTQGASVPITSNSGYGGVIVISKVAKANLEGKINSITVTRAGAGFRANDQLLITAVEGGSGAAANVGVVNEDETFHPSSYDIVGTRIIDLANTVIANTLNVNQSEAYSNLANIYTNTSNLIISTSAGTGNTTTLILSQWQANSNVYFETGDYIRVDGSYLRVVTTNTINAIITVESPGIVTGSSNLPFIIYKKPNANSILSQSMVYWQYANCGPIVSIKITNPGSKYNQLPIADVLSNTAIRSLGILGRLEINNGGMGYQTGDILQFINKPGDYGDGANGVVTSVDANGTIEAVAFYPNPGYQIGGFGYSMKALPDINVISANNLASGANIAVTAIIGDGELLEPKSNLIGSIETLKVISGGVGYLENPTLDLTQYGDGKAQAFVNIVTGIFTYPGRYVNDDGHLSGRNFIQDHDYYQPFTYVIKSVTPLSRFRASILDFAHPAGAKLYGQCVSIDVSGNTIIRSNVTQSVYNTFATDANSIVKFEMDNGGFVPTGAFANTGNIYYDIQNSWIDVANANNSGTLANGAYFVGSGVTFGGVYSNSSVIVPHNNYMNVNSDMITIVTWFNASNTTGHKYLVNKVNSANTQGFRLFIHDANLVVRLGDSSANNVVDLGRVNTNTWYQTAITYQGLSIVGYINGVAVANNTGTPNAKVNTASTMYIGSDFGLRPNTFEGKIAMVEIFNASLSNTEISNQFSKYRGRYAV